MWPGIHGRLARLLWACLLSSGPAGVVAPGADIVAVNVFSRNAHVVNRATAGDEVVVGVSASEAVDQPICAFKSGGTAAANAATYKRSGQAVACQAQTDCKTHDANVAWCVSPLPLPACPLSDGRHAG